MLLLMIFSHIIDDYCLQKLGMLGLMKQKSWWKENAPDALYKYDYIVALIMHSFSWSFMIMLPYLVKVRFDLSLGYYLVFIVNLLIHCIIDDLKANKHLINLWTDQIVHICQIVVTYRVLEYIIK